MKTLKSVLTAIALLFVCVAVNATIKPIVTKPTKNDVVNFYIDAIAHGKTNNLNNILDDELQFNIMRGANVNTLNKGQLIDYLKNNTPTDETVTATATVAQEDDNSSVVKVEFKYADYTRTDLVTLENSNGWVITKVQSSFK
jgi:Tfp pilus tip-associated adhesin PilY1